MRQGGLWLLRVEAMTDTREDIEALRNAYVVRSSTEASDIVRLAAKALELMDLLDDAEAEREEDKGFTNAIAQGNTEAMKHALGPDTYNRFWGPELERLGRVMDTITVERDAANAKVESHKRGAESLMVQLVDSARRISTLKAALVEAAIPLEVLNMDNYVGAAWMAPDLIREIAQAVISVRNALMEAKSD